MSAIAENALFAEYRPTYHVIAKHSFMNDPCGAAYIPETGQYLLCYQLGANVDSFADAWGCCVSGDMVSWRDWPNAITPGPGAYDCLKVFSGSIFARQEKNGTVLYLFYTSIRHLPIHWTKRYEIGCESQSVAISHDLGKTWSKSPANPLLKEPTTGQLTTGWRDPFVSIWPTMSRLLKLPRDTVYMLISSGTRDFGPRLVLYKSSNLTSWDELGPIFAPQAGDTFGDSSEINYGHNFECGSFFSLDGREYLAFGVEGDDEHARHASRWTMWLAGELVLDDASRPTFVPLAAGTADHDILYAMHITRDKDDNLIQYGWLDEDDNAKQHDQGWAGCHALPRLVSTVTLPLTKMPPENGPWIIDQATQTMTTLSLRPVSTAKMLRNGAVAHTGDFTSLQSQCFELEAKFTNLPIDSIVFDFRVSANGQERTRLVIDLLKHSITLDRSKSSAKNGNATSRSAHFQVFEEVLDLRVFCDHSVVEIFANDRFCMSSRIYPDPESLGIALNFEGSEQHIANVLYDATIYDGLSNAWPKRRSETGLR